MNDNGDIIVLSLSRFFRFGIFLQQPGYWTFLLRLLHIRIHTIYFFPCFVGVHNLPLHAAYLLKMQKNSMKVNRKCICFKIENYVSCRFRKIIVHSNNVVDRRALKFSFFFLSPKIYFSVKVALSSNFVYTESSFFSK